MLTIIKTFKRYILLLVVVLSASSFSASGGYDWCYVLGKMANDFEISSKFRDFIYKGHEDLKYIYKGLIDHPNWVRLNDDLYTKINTPAFKNKIDKVAELYDVPKVFKLPPGCVPPCTFEGIDFDKFGFPNLKPFLSNPNHVVKIKVNGTSQDYFDAIKELKKVAGVQNVRSNQFGTPIFIKVNGVETGPFTWHHHQDGTSMMPVIQAKHQDIQNYHTGGRATASRGLVNLFNY